MRPILMHCATRIFFALSLIVGANVAAVPVTIDFEDFPGFAYEDIVRQGVRFSPKCHIDVENGYSHDSKWMGFDYSGCWNESGYGRNQNYLGPAVEWSALYVTAEGGNVISLKSFVPVIPYFEVRSSKGGLATSTSFQNSIEVPFHFSGPEWTNLDWLLFTTSGGDPVGFDDLQLQVHRIDEPGSVLLILGAMSWFVARRRRILARRVT